MKKVAIVGSNSYSLLRPLLGSVWTESFLNVEHAVQISPDYLVIGTELGIEATVLAARAAQEELGSFGKVVIFSPVDSFNKGIRRGLRSAGIRVRICNQREIIDEIIKAA